MSVQFVPTRIVLNFASACALRCEWCYVPFDGSKVTLAGSLRVVDRARELGFDSITFGGGDPFQYSFIDVVLRRAKALGMFVHVDTHGKKLRESESILNLLWEAVDLLGLPMDGPDAATHDMMRSAPGHFDVIRRRLLWLQPFRERLKVNTLLTQQNIAVASDIARLIVELRPTRWSIYQYWQLGPAARAERAHLLDDALFVQHATLAADVATRGGSSVEVTRRNDRRNTYPIVHHDGTIVVHTPAPENSLVRLGSIFETNALSQIRNACGAERIVALGRYRRALPGGI